MREAINRIRRARQRRACRRHGHAFSEWTAKADKRFQYRVCLLCEERQERTATAAALERIGNSITSFGKAVLDNTSRAVEALAAVPVPAAAGGLFDPDRGPAPVPGVVLQMAGLDPAPTALTPLVQHTAPQRAREHDIGLPVPAAPTCPGHERVIRELRAEVRRLDAENWRLRCAVAAAAAAGLDENNGNGSTTSGGRDTGGPTTQAGDDAGEPLRVGTVDRTHQPPRDAALGESGGAADGD